LEYLWQNVKNQYSFISSSSKYGSKTVIYATVVMVLSNTDLDENEHIQTTLGKKKYKNAEYDDNTVEWLMKYLEVESYEQSENFLEHCHIPKYN
jgi:hypothetical protein